MSDLEPSLVAATPVVDVWAADLDSATVVAAATATALSAEEMRRAARFHDSTARNRFIERRAILRKLLAHYLAADPTGITISSGEEGKPFLAHSDLRFSVAHSANAAVYAFARNREIGVDVEYRDPDLCTFELATAFFAPAEIAAIEEANAGRRLLAFYRCWTRKEAYLKARGCGSTRSLSDFAISCGAEARLLYDRQDSTALTSWFVVDLPELARDGFTAALAFEHAIASSPPAVVWHNFSETAELCAISALPRRAVST